MLRKFLIAAAALLLILSAAACGTLIGATSTPPETSAPASTSPTGTSETPAASDPGVSDAEQKAVLDAFQALLKTPGSEKEALASLTKELPKLSAENASQMVLYFDTYQNDAVMAGTPVTDALVQLITKSAGEPYNEKTLNDLSGITNTELKAALQALFDRGYKLIVPEGMYQAVIDYDVYKSFEPYVTKDIAAYIEIKASESESRALEDAAIIIPMDEVLKRAQACEVFLETYPQSAKLDEVKRMYGSYVDSYFYGQNNTPAFDYQTNKLNQEFLDSYQKAEAGSTASPIAKAAADYLKVLEDNGHKLTDSVKTYREKMITDLKTN